MTTPTQTQLAAQGIEILRQEFTIGCYDGEAEEALRALCDYAEAQIKAYVRAGQAGGAARSKKMTKERRSEIAKAGAAARWKKKPE